MIFLFFSARRFALLLVLLMLNAACQRPDSSAPHQKGSDNQSSVVNENSPADEQTKKERVNAVPTVTTMSLNVIEDSPAGGQLIARDDDGDVLTFKILTPPVKGIVVLMDAMNGAFTYLPAANATGDDQFEFGVNDGKTDSATAAVAVHIDPVNDAPVGLDRAYTLDEDGTLNGQFSGSDIDGDVLTFGVAQGPRLGTVRVLDSTRGTFVYTPNTNANGDDSFTYLVSDGKLSSNAATVTLSIRAINDLPIAKDDNITINEGQTARLSPASNDTDVDGDILSIANFTQPLNGSVTRSATGELVYTAKAYFSGRDAFLYTVSDGKGGNAQGMVNITVVAVNHLPVAIADSATTMRDTAVTIDVLRNDTVLIDSPWVVSLGSAPNNGSAVVNTDKTVTYTPAADFLGADSFSYTVTDGNGDASTATVRLSVKCATPCVRIVQLEWTPNTEPDISGYNVYHGTVSGAYTEKLWVGNSAIYQYSTAMIGDHFFALSAVNTKNAESQLSAEVVINIPPPP